MVWLPDGEEFFEDMFIRFNRIYEDDGQTDGHRMTAYATLIHKSTVQDRTRHRLAAVSTFNSSTLWICLW